LLFADFGAVFRQTPSSPAAETMARLRNERRPRPLRGTGLALLGAAIVALGLSGAAFSATSASTASLRSRQASFREFIARLWPLAAERGVKRATFDRAFASVSFDPQVVAMAQSQPEFARPVSDYVASALSADRITRGRELARSESLWLDRARETFGVDRAAILGIWGLETDFGGFPGSNNVFQALASLAYVRFRGDYFRDELMSALVMLETGGVAPSLMRGSWAGAMGQTQFMPSSYLAYAVAFERHGRRDIWTSEADAIGSTANYLAKHGWTKGLPWGFEVRLPAAFTLSDADSSAPAPFSSFAARGVKRADGSPLPESGSGRLMILAGLNGPVFLVTSNFDVIKTYNNSTAYALAAGLLGDAVEGRRGLVAQWPADRPLTAAQIETLQARLKTMGYDVGEIDGKIGDATRSAVRAYQERNGLRPDGYADLSLFRRVSASP
jgi:peptidoglycan lytic transglycosylase B